MFMACVGQMALFLSLEHSDLGFVSASFIKSGDIQISDLNHNG